LLVDVCVTLKYLDATRGRNLRWVFASSGGTVYGPDALTPIAEDAPTNPACSYGIAKLAIEKYFALYKRLHNIEYVIARLANPYGPGQDPLSGQGVIAAMIYKALIGESIQIWGDGEVIRDYIYIDDLVDGLITISRGRSGQIFNIGSGMGVSLNALAKKIAHALSVNLMLDFKSARAIDVRNNVLNNSKIISEFHWEIKTSFNEGIICTANWIKLLKKFNQ
jgi:UDP-glucose 4-epimerase